MPVLSSLVRYPQKCVCVYSVRCSINMTPVALIVGLALENIIECTMVCACPSPPSSCPPSYSLLKAVPKRSRKQIAAHQKSSIFDNILGPSGSPMAIVARIISADSLFGVSEILPPRLHTSAFLGSLLFLALSSLATSDIDTISILHVSQIIYTAHFISNLCCCPLPFHNRSTRRLYICCKYFVSLYVLFRWILEALRLRFELPIPFPIVRHLHLTWRTYTSTYVRLAPTPFQVGC